MLKTKFKFQGSYEHQNTNNKKGIEKLLEAFIILTTASDSYIESSDLASVVTWGQYP